MNQYTSETPAVSQLPALPPVASPFAPQENGPPITLKSLMSFLLGNRQAIEQFAASPRAVFVGLLFVLSAGLAREYDGEYLFAEPYHLLLPLVASLATSFVLYVMLSVTARCWRDSGHWWIGYARFLGLYWMTAPLAWLYAIPVERFLSAYDATAANLSLLAIVSLWRVALMIRVVSVVFRSNVLSAAMVVLFFADIIAIPAVAIVSLATVSIMGGIRLTEAEQLIGIVSDGTFSLGLMSLPIWFVGATSVFARGLLRWPEREMLGIGEGARGATIARSLWSAAVVLLAFGLALLPVTQFEQSRRNQIESLVQQDDIRGAVVLLATFEKRDLPPHWDPPPRYGRWGTKPPLIDAVESLLRLDAPPSWLTDNYLAKVDAAFASTRYDTPVYRQQFGGAQVNDAERWLAIVEKLPDGEAFTRKHASVFRSWLGDTRLLYVLKGPLSEWLMKCGVDSTPIEIKPTDYP